MEVSFLPYLSFLWLGEHSRRNSDEIQGISTGEEDSGLEHGEAHSRVKLAAGLLRDRLSREEWSRLWLYWESKIQETGTRSCWASHTLVWGPTPAPEKGL